MADATMVFYRQRKPSRDYGICPQITTMKHVWEDDLPQRLAAFVAPASLIALGAFGLYSPSAMADDAKAPAPSSSAAPSTPGGQSQAGQDAQKKLSEEDPTKTTAKADPGTFKESADPPVSQQANGMWVDKDGNPTPYVAKDGTPGWFLASGYRRYGANCLQCHGPDALGSSYAPSLVDALKTMPYAQFLQTVAAGKKDVSNSSNLVMPSFAENKNVQCYINDIYVYIRARSLGLWARQEPTKHADKPSIYGTQETACIGF